MALLKIRDANGVVHEMVSLKGNPGGMEPHTHSSADITHGARPLSGLLQEIEDKADGASNDVAALRASLNYLGDTVSNTSAKAETADMKADEALGYALDNKSKLSDVETLTDELNAGFVRLEDEIIPGIHEQLGDIDEVLDAILALQNALIGGDA